jgi:4,5-dihydroxyphthalate decarboxylase
MSKVKLSVAIGNYDRTAAIFDGRAPIEGCEIEAIALEPEEAFHRAFKFQEFDVSEISLSSHVATVARGSNAYVAIPAYLSRVFRHSGIYVRADRGIREPKDLKGKTIGLPEYQMTANVWIRGLLQDEYGVRPQDVRWRRGGLEEPGREERTPIALPSEVDLQAIPKDKTLSAMLETGELDGFIGARPPSCFSRGAPKIMRLFENYQEVEQAYYRKTGIFPIMHVVGVRRSLIADRPWLAVSLYKAFLHAKELCLRELGQIGHLATSLPWTVAETERVKALMGPDFWSYGLEGNQHALDAFLRYMHEQSLTPRLVTAQEIFVPSTLDLAKI